MLVSHECPTCGAPIQAPDDVGPIHCRFCGRDFERKEPPHQPVAAASTPNVPSASVPPSTVPALPWALAIGTLVVVAVVVAGGFMVFRAPAPETATAATTAPPTVQAAPKPAPARSWFGQKAR